MTVDNKKIVLPHTVISKFKFKPLYLYNNIYFCSNVEWEVLRLSN